MTKSSRLLPRNGAVACALLVLVLFVTTSSYAAPVQNSRGTGPANTPFTSPNLLIPSGIDDTTIVSGSITDTVWTLEGSPYAIQGDVVIPETGFLTIEPGVEVVFMGHYKFTVNGRLKAVGVTNEGVVDSIKFSAADTSLGWGGIRLQDAHILSRLEYCQFSYGNAQGNWPDDRGGAIYIYGSIQAIKHCSFVSNKAAQDGGAVYLWGATPEFSYNLFWHNTSGSGNGHAVYLGNCPGLVLNHQTIAGNGGSVGWSLFTAMGTNLQMQNSIIWDSTHFNYQSGSIKYCDIPMATTVLPNLGEGNINSNPQFLNLAAGNLSLKIFSPCIDGAAANSPYQLEPIPNGGRANMGYDGNSTSATKSLPILSFNGDTLSTSIAPINFGAQKRFIPDTLNLNLYNIGRQADSISAIQISDPQFTCNFAVLAEPISGKIIIGPDSSKVLQIIFNPTVIDSANATLNFVDNDPLNTPVVTVKGIGIEPKLEIDPINFDFLEIFGVATVGDTLRLPVTFRNTGTNGPTIQSNLVVQFSPMNANFRLVDFGAHSYGNQTIPVGQSVTDTVLFVPSVQSLNLTADLIVVSNAGDTTIHCHGAALQPQMHWTPDSLGFGVVPLSAGSKIMGFQVWNTGGVDLLLDRFYLSDSVNYYFTSTAVRTIPTNDTITVDIAFDPTVAGPLPCTAQIGSNITTADSMITVTITGTGTSQQNWWIGDSSGTWTAANSPYFIVGDFNVPVGDTLIIEPGVEVKFEGNFELAVGGMLIAKGTPADQITFSPILSTGTWQGLTIKSGSSDSTVLQYCDFSQGAGKNLGTGTLVGGAMRVENAAPLIEYCTFHDNNADSGGALALLSWSKATVRQCTFDHDSAGYGGALFGSWFADSEIDSCTFTNNYADSTGGAVFLAGSLGKLHRCVITSNKTLKMGGGVSLGDGAAPEMWGNKIYNNMAMVGGGLAIRGQSKPYIHDEWVFTNAADSSGGGFFIQDGCTPLINRTLVAENTAVYGQAFYTLSSGSVINYCTFAGSPADTLGWLFSAGAGDKSLITNSIIGTLNWDGVLKNSIYDLGSAITITYSDVADSLLHLFPGQGNHNEAPGFSGTGDIYQRYLLADESPAKSWTQDLKPIGFEGGSEMSLTWNTTLSLLQNPVQLNAFEFIITSSIPLTAPPYVYITQDLPDTLGMVYVPIDSAAMLQVSPMIYNFTYRLAILNAPAKAVFTMKNIMSEYRSFEVPNIISRLYSQVSSITFGNSIEAEARSVSGEGVWMVMPETYCEPKPVSSQQVGLGESYLISANVEEFAEGRIIFHLNADVLGNRIPEGCSIAQWNGSDWDVLPSYLTSDKMTVWSSMPKPGSYRLVWGVGAQNVLLPDEVTLAQNYPNPFNPETTIRFSLPDAGKVSIDVFDLTGRKVITLLDGHQSAAGYHQVVWSGRNQMGEAVSSGVYFYRLQTADQYLTKKMILLR